MPRIGLDMVHFAPLLTDPVGGKATYGKPVPLVGGIKANVEHNSDSSQLDADDHTTDVVNSYSGTTVGLDLRDLPPEAACLLQGHQLSTDGGVIRTHMDSAPYGALLWRSLKSDGKYQYNALFKGKFGLVGSTAETKKKGGVTFQTPSLKADFLARDSDGLYEYYLDETEANQAVIATWFDQVPAPVPASGGITPPEDPEE